jgi:hypothetical protein
MSVDLIKASDGLSRRSRVQKSEAMVNPEVVYVGPGTKWASPIKKQDVIALISFEPDIAAAVAKRGATGHQWTQARRGTHRAAAVAQGHLYDGLFKKRHRAPGRLDAGLEMLQKPLSSSDLARAVGKALKSE